MSVKVRGLRPGRLMVLAIPTLLLTSVAVAAAPSLHHQTPDLRSSVSRTAFAGSPLGDVEGGSDGRGAWFIEVANFQSLRPARAGGADLGPAGTVIGVTVKVGTDPVRSVLTNARSVDQLLGAMGIRLSGGDRVRPGVAAPLAPADRIEVVRIRTIREGVTVVVPFTTLIQYSKDLDLGQTRIATPGVPGRVARTYEVTYRNGVEVHRDLVGEQNLAAPTSQVEVRGTKAPLPIRPAGHSECGVASWYAGRTAGLVAAHKSLPFGTRVTVHDVQNGGAVTVVINDRGPYIAGRIIDLSDDAFAILAPLGQGTARVCISW